ncbi:MAG: GtrA family protein [bacterium]|nr:GtrA family protein [bacterium]
MSAPGSGRNVGGAGESDLPPDPAMSGSAATPVTRALAAPAEHRPEWHRLVRFGAVSAVVTPTTLLILWMLHGVVGRPAWQANLLAVSAGAVPAYLLNRYWVWGRSGRNRLWGEVVPFWSITLVGAAASTVAVDAAGARWDSTGLLVLVNLGTYGVLWLVKFAFLDRVLWPARRASSGARTRRAAGAVGG